MDTLYLLSNKKLRSVPTDFRRYLSFFVHTDERLIGILGARGTGKTVLLLQLMKDKLPREESLYMSLDDIYFLKHGLTDTAVSFIQKGGKCLFLDEVNKYPTWWQEIKNLYDNYPELSIVFTGSSVIEISRTAGDISRRAAIYHLYPLSFREYLEMEHIYTVKPFSLKEITQKHTHLAEEISAYIKPLRYFGDYLKFGSYPFFREGKISYFEKLKQTVNVTLENDIPTVQRIDYNSVIKLKKLLSLLTETVPYKPNISELAAKVEVQRQSLYKYLDLMAKAGLLGLLPAKLKGITALNKPEKIYPGSTSLMYALSDGVPYIGILRETFFFNQLTQHYKISGHATADFTVENNAFEIGGKNKKTMQIKGIKNSWIVSDNIEVGFERRIPLWLFGFLY